MSLHLDHLDLLAEPADFAAGKPLQLAIDAIDEDPEQPRQEFDAEALAELADTIRERGVRSPVSVRHHPDHPGRWLLNFGARRLRASRLAGRLEIPALVDDCADTYDQVIENEQREGLTPLELALFVERRLAAGEKQNEIANRLGKSRQYITYVTALVQAPDWLLSAYREGRCRGIKELYDLRKLHQSHAARVEDWIAEPGTGPITRQKLDAFRQEHEALLGREAKASPACAVASAMPPAKVETQTSAEGPRGSSGRDKHRSGTSEFALLLQAQYQGERYVINTRKAPEDNAMVFVRPAGGGAECAVPASSLTLLGFERHEESNR